MSASASTWPRPRKRTFSNIVMDDEESLMERKISRTDQRCSPGFIDAALDLGRSIFEGCADMLSHTLRVIGDAVAEPIEMRRIQGPLHPARVKENKNEIIMSADDTSVDSEGEEEEGESEEHVDIIYDSDDGVHEEYKLSSEWHEPERAPHFSPFPDAEAIDYALVYSAPPPLTPVLKRATTRAPSVQPAPPLQTVRSRDRAFSFTGSSVADNFAKPAPVLRKRAASLSSKETIDLDTWRPAPDFIPKTRSPVDERGAYPPEIFHDPVLRHEWQRKRESRRSLVDLRKRAKDHIEEGHKLTLQTKLEREAEQARKAREEAEKLLPTGPPPLSANEEAEYLQCMRKSDADVLVNKFNIIVLGEHIKRLLPGGWLNDEIVNFYMELLSERVKSNPTLPTAHFFNSYFYFYLSRKGMGYDYAAVRRWTLKAKVDIFALERVVAPIHLGVHWCLAVINMSEQRIEYYDSMGGKNPECIAILQRYLHDEHKDKKGCDIDLSGWSTYTPGALVPQQGNGFDCGVFTCQFARCRASNLPFRFSQRDMPAFRKSMVIEVKQAKLRL